MEEKKSNNDSAAGRRFQHQHRNINAPLLQLTKKLSNNRRALPQYLQPGSISVSKALRGLAVENRLQ